MKKILLTLTLTISLIFLMSSCKSPKKSLGLTENIPDEYQVTKMKPLEVPPHFNLSKNKLNKKTKKPSGSKFSNEEKMLIEDSLKK